MLLTTRSALSRFSRPVASNREIFYRGLKTLPQELARSARDHYRDRLRRSSGKPLLGEYAPWLLADLLPLDRQDLAHRIAPAWIQLYSSTLFMDDVLDRSLGPLQPPALLASALLMQRGLSDMFRVLPAKAEVRIRMDRYFVAAANATLTEIRHHRDNVKDYSDEDVARLGEKVSLLTLCASCLLAADGKIAGQEELLLPVEFLATGAQLFDDVTDWEEDWQEGNHTFLLSRTIKGLRKLGVSRTRRLDSFSASEVLAGMILTGSLAECVNRGLECLRKVAAWRHLKRGSPADGLLHAMIEENTAFGEELGGSREFLEHVYQGLPKGRTNWLRRLVGLPKVKRELVWVRRRLQILAQNT